MSRRSSLSPLSTLPPASPFNPSALTLREQAIAALAAGISGEADRPPPADEETERLRELCRQGNPFPLVAHQWPELIVKNKVEQRFFLENLEQVRLNQTTEGIDAAIFAAGNPVLRIDWWQHIILAAMFDLSIGEIFIAGATGVGKGASVSMGVNLWYDAHEEARIHLTGRDRDHARRNIFGETIKWRDRVTKPGPGTSNSEAITHTKRHYVQLLNPDASSSTAGEAFSGQHSKNTFYVFDEASAHPDSFVDNARRNAHMIVALSNPRTLYGWFRNGFKDVPQGKRIAVISGHMRMRLCMSIGGADCINVRYQRLKVPIAPKQGIEISSVFHASNGSDSSRAVAGSSI